MRFVTAGESHGKGLIGILEGVPSGLCLQEASLREELSRRRRFYGRSKRMQLEDDTPIIYSGVRDGITTGAPISFLIKNNDSRLISRPISCDNSVDCVAADFSGDGENCSNIALPKITKPRPGHADYAGMAKYGIVDARNIAERASGRETATRTLVGAICKQVLSELSITICSHVTNIGGAKSSISYYSKKKSIAELINENTDTAFINNSKHDTNILPNAQKNDINIMADTDSLRCLDSHASQKMIEIVDNARQSGDTVGGEIEVIVSGLIAGFGSCMQFDQRLDYLISGMLMSIPSIKGIAIGNKEVFCGMGSDAADPIVDDDGRIFRPKNYGGGIEGGISNGADIVLSLMVKPVPTMRRGAQTIDFASGQAANAHHERSDICVVPAVSVVCENLTAFVLAQALLNQLGGDTMDELKQRYQITKQKSPKFDPN